MKTLMILLTVLIPSLALAQPDDYREVQARMEVRLDTLTTLLTEARQNIASTDKRFAEALVQVQGLSMELKNLSYQVQENKQTLKGVEIYVADSKKKIDLMYFMFNLFFGAISFFGSLGALIFAFVKWQFIKASTLTIIRRLNK